MGPWLPSAFRSLTFCNRHIDYRARLHQVFVLISTNFLRIANFLMRTEAFKWIKKRYTTITVISNNSSNSDNATDNQSYAAVALGKHLPRAETTTTTKTIATKITTTTATDTAKTSDCFSEVLVASDTNIDAWAAGKEAETAAVLGRKTSNNISKLVSNINSRNNSMMPNSNIVSPGNAPLAIEEEEAESGENSTEGSHQSTSIHYNICSLHQSSHKKSRVRHYLRRFQERLTGQSAHGTQAILPSISFTSAALENQLSSPVEYEPQRLPSWNEDRAASPSSLEGVDDSCEVIAFDLSTFNAWTQTVNQPESDQLATIDGRLEVQLGEIPAQQRDVVLAALIDAYLSDVYPVHQRGTRAVLMRQARDLLVSHYDGCLQVFELRFLVHFAEIAAALKSRHADGEYLVWCRGWPLAAPTGEVILHLGSLEPNLLQPSDFYLCIKPVDNSEDPRLFAIWRSTEKSDLSLYSRCIDHNDPETYLSIFSLEMMLSEELPQLLQNMLVGVEDAIGRLSVNELTSPSVGHQPNLDSANNNTRNNNHVHNNHSANNVSVNRKTAVASSLASLKCGLKRSELITKNKMLKNKFMLRRLTNRQDSMTSTSSGNSCSSAGSSSSDELPNQGAASALNNNYNNAASLVPPVLPLFCLGNSFPHIDSDEENADEKRNSLDYDTSVSYEIVVPPNICEIPEKLLTSGIYLPGTRDLKGRSIVTIDAECLLNSGLNCYEIATVLLYYSTIPQNTSDFRNSNSLQNQHQQQSQQPDPPKFTILIAIGSASHLNAIDLICQSLKLLARRIGFCEILAVCHDRSLLLLSKQRSETTTTNAEHDKQQRFQATYSVKFISVDEVTTSVALNQIPRGKLGGLHHHDARKWLEFFALLEPFQSQCIATGQRLVTAMNEIRCADKQGLPTRRQLYAQHRALSRALMDSELHNVRKSGAQTLTRLQDLARDINIRPSTDSSKNNNNTTYSFSLNHNRDSSSYTSASLPSSGVPMTSSFASASKQSILPISTNNNNNNGRQISDNNIDVAIRLKKVTLLFNEVDRAAKRLEQLTEQRRERLRKLTRQRALQDEINEITAWITIDGNDNLQRFSNLQLDCETAFKQHEQDFEKFYFISMKHLAKGRDLYEAANDIDSLHESAANLKPAVDCFSEKLELARERIEGAARLHQLLSFTGHLDEKMREEMERLADKIGLSELLQKTRLLKTSEISGNSNGSGIGYLERSKVTPNRSNLQFNVNLNCSRGGAPIKLNQNSSMSTISVSASGIGTGSGTCSEHHGACHCHGAWSRHVEDVESMLNEDSGVHKILEEEEESKIADSGLGGCERCDGTTKLSWTCSCQSLHEASHLFDKSHSSDELDDEGFERNAKQFLNINSPMEANLHLQCHVSNMELPKLENLSFLDPKIQKTLLLIMHEMIGTERDYVRSLHYVIENYVEEVLRDDITQPLRGQRYVIFGNIEKIFEFHSSHFLRELERYASHPLKVGAAFLEMESKFYLYALYNKNKPKSDTLMSEYGTTFFKAKQLELKDKMDLASYLLKPVQRMGKYALLLQQLVKACSSVQGAAFQEIAADVEELQQAEEMVKFQLRHGNDLLAMDSLRDCDVNVKEQGRLLRQNEFLVTQGRGGKTALRQVFLFEELVLFSKARRFPDHKNLDFYLYKNSIKTSDIGLTAHVGDSTTKFEIWFRKRKPEDTWTLQCISEDIKSAWTEEISRILWEQAKRNREIRLAEMSSMGIGSKPCLDIRPSNNQISDRSITITQLGKTAKLRNSFVGLHPEQGKVVTRPISLISESSTSSETSTSSTSTGSSSLSGGKLRTYSSQPAAGLELINETQTLTLATSESSGCNTNSNNTNTISSSTVGILQRNHRRSTTLVSQLSIGNEL